MPRAIPPATSIQSVVPEAAAPPCANVTGARTSAAIAAIRNQIIFLVILSPCYEFAARRWLPEALGGGRSHAGGCLIPDEYSLVFLGSCQAEIHEGKNRKDESLQHGFENVKERKGQRNRHRNHRRSVPNGAQMTEEREQPDRQSQERNENQFAHHHVRPETNREREQPREMAERFDDEHDG